MSEIQKSADRLIDNVTEQLEEKGWSHLRTDIDPVNAAAIKGLLTAMSDRLTINTRIDPEISVIAPREKTKILANSSQEMSFHTDNVYLEDPCKKIVLFCSVQAEEGGSNELIDGLGIARDLPTDIQEALTERKWRWTHPATQKPSDEFAVLDKGQDRLRWWRTSLLNKEMASIAIADSFEDAISTSPNKQHISMQPGDILVTDNTRILHNRSTFVGERRVYRARFW